MISFLKSWIEGISITVIIATLVEMILPKGNLKKYIKMILAIYILFSIISPFVDNKKLYTFNFEEEINNYTPKTQKENKDLNKEVNKNLENVYLDVFKEKLEKTINKYGYNIRSILIDANFNGSEDNVGIKKILIVLSSKNNNYKYNNKEKEENETIEENNIEIELVEEVKINQEEINTNRTNTNLLKEKITLKEINELKKYLVDFYDIDKEIIEIKAY